MQIYVLVDVGDRVSVLYVACADGSLFFVLGKEDVFFFVQMECYMFLVTEINMSQNIIPFDDMDFFLWETLKLNCNKKHL